MQLLCNSFPVTSLREAVAFIRRLFSAQNKQNVQEGLLHWRCELCKQLRVARALCAQCTERLVGILLERAGGKKKKKKAVEGGTSERHWGASVQCLRRDFSGEL